MSDKYKWFKFDAESWLSGSIQFQPPEYQAVFMNIVSLYWKNKRPVTAKDVFVRYPRDKQMVTDALQSLAGACLINDCDGYYTIGFLSEQINENEVRSDKKRDAANARWGNDMQVHAGALHQDADKSKNKNEIRMRGEADGQNSPDLAAIDFFKDKSCYVPIEDQHWFINCFKRFTADFLIHCIDVSKKQRKSQGFKQRPCRSDLTDIMKEEKGKFSGGVFSEGDAS